MDLAPMNDPDLKTLEALLRQKLQAIAPHVLETREKRTERVMVLLTPSEKAILEETCAGIGTSKFLRSLLFRARPLVRRQPVPIVNRETYSELGRIGQNLNQQTRLLRSERQQASQAQDLAPSLLSTNLAVLESLTLLLPQLQQALVPLDGDPDDDLEPDATELERDPQ